MITFSYLTTHGDIPTKSPARAHRHSGNIFQKAWPAITVYGTCKSYYGFDKTRPGSNAQVPEFSNQVRYGDAQVPETSNQVRSGGDTQV